MNVTMLLFAVQMGIARILQDTIIVPANRAITATDTTAQVDTNAFYIYLLIHLSDINECLNSTTCSKNGLCTNLPGSFKCACKSGFTGDGFQCTGKQDYLNSFNLIYSR